MLSFKTTLNSVITGRHFFLARIPLTNCFSYVICPYEEALLPRSTDGR